MTPRPCASPRVARAWPISGLLAQRVSAIDSTHALGGLWLLDPRPGSPRSRPRRAPRVDRGGGESAASPVSGNGAALRNGAVRAPPRTRNPGAGNRTGEGRQGGSRSLPRHVRDVPRRPRRAALGDRRGSLPAPPQLAEAASDLTDAELFWITKHGIQMTGMPGFGATHGDDELWDIVAVVKRLPDMDPQHYRPTERMEHAPAPSDGHHDDQHHH